MTFVSKNPQSFNNADVGENAITISSDKIAVGFEVLGYYKHKYIDDKYKKENYVIKDKETGRDILMYSCTSLTRELAFYDQGQLLKLVYKGKFENKSGPFRGKMAHIWEVFMDSSFVPNQEFIASLQAEVRARKAAVMGVTQPQSQTIFVSAPAMHSATQPLAQPSVKSAQPSWDSSTSVNSTNSSKDFNPFG